MQASMRWVGGVRPRLNIRYTLKCCRSQVLGLFCALSLAACSLAPPTESESLALRSEEQRAALQNWQFRGRIDTPDQRASLRWRQVPAQFDLLLRGPFGFGGVRIIGNAQQVEINDGHEVVLSQEPVADIYRRTGLYVPLQALPYWALGLPSPDYPAQLQRNLAGYIEQIEQAGWVIQLQDYREQDGVSFPHAIELTHADQQFSIQVNQWKWSQ